MVGECRAVHAVHGGDHVGAAAGHVEVHHGAGRGVGPDASQGRAVAGTHKVVEAVGGSRRHPLAVGGEGDVGDAGAIELHGGGPVHGPVLVVEAQDETVARAGHEVPAVRGDGEAQHLRGKVTVVGPCGGGVGVAAAGMDLEVGSVPNVGVGLPGHGEPVAVGGEGGGAEGAIEADVLQEVAVGVVEVRVGVARGARCDEDVGTAAGDVHGGDGLGEALAPGGVRCVLPGHVVEVGFGGAGACVAGGFLHAGHDHGPVGGDGHVVGALVLEEAVVRLGGHGTVAEVEEMEVGVGLGVGVGVVRAQGHEAAGVRYVEVQGAPGVGDGAPPDLLGILRRRGSGGEAGGEERQDQDGDVVLREVHVTTWGGLRGGGSGR